MITWGDCHIEWLDDLTIGRVVHNETGTVLEVNAMDEDLEGGRDSLLPKLEALLPQP